MDDINSGTQRPFDIRHPGAKTANDSVVKVEELNLRDVARLIETDRFGEPWYFGTRRRVNGVSKNEEMKGRI